MKSEKIALVTGDGSGPEMMAVACKIAILAARMDNISIEFEETPMGWNAFEEFGDTLPESSLARATEIGTLFFGGVGDPKYDQSLGRVYPDMMPEAKALLTIRSKWGLLLNFRPMIYYRELKHLSRVRPDGIPDDWIVEQHFIRFLLEDSYFGNRDLRDDVRHGLKYYSDELIDSFALKEEVDGQEPLVIDMGYYRHETVLKYLRHAFQYARERNLPLICIDKANVMARYVLWRKTAEWLRATEFQDVLLRHLYVDAANALLFTPAELHGVITCGNEHGDILSDGAAGALGSMGIMCSSAVNPDTNAAMFESGAGTAPELAGQDKANPIGRILTAGMMLRHIGAPNGAAAIEKAIRNVLSSGAKTADLLGPQDDKGGCIGTIAMADKIIAAL